MFKLDNNGITLLTARSTTTITFKGNENHNKKKNALARLVKLYNILRDQVKMDEKELVKLKVKGNMICIYFSHALNLDYFCDFC